MSVLVNLLGLLLVFFYLPPDNAGLPNLVPGVTYLAVINIVVILAAVGRVFDAVTDPIIAVASDRSTNSRGRRIPFMSWGAIPAAIATWLMFVPPVQSESGWNVLWLVAVQAVLFIALTAYMTPAFSLVADLGNSPDERLDLATWTSAAWAVGILVAATAPFIASMVEANGLSTLRSWQVAVAVICVVAVVAMYVPVFLIDEPRWARSEPASVPIREVVGIIGTNPFFKFYAAADFAYFAGIMIIQTGLLYYVTVLLELSDALTAPLLLAMIVVATMLYPVVNRMAKRGSGKSLVITAFVISAVDFGLISQLGRLPFAPMVQAFIVIMVFAVGFAILGVIPQWILTDISEHSTLKSGTATAASFFAVRTFLQKIAQTGGVIVFALLTSFGRDVGNDLGIRLTGIAGVVLYVVAAAIMTRYDEARMQSELATLSAQDATDSEPITDAGWTGSTPRASDCPEGR